MATPKRPTKEQANENRRKQQVLKQAGYNIKIDGSWGPWLEQQYKKVITWKAPKTNQASVGVMALPAAAALGSGAGALSLPAISAPSLAAALPVALVAGPIAVEVYNKRHGIYPRIELTPEQQQSTVYSPDATRVSRPIVVSRRAPVEMERPIGEMYINPTLTRSRAISMATDTATVAPRDTATVTPRDTVTPQNPPNPTNEPQNKRGWRDKLADKIADKIRGKKSADNPPSNPETKSNGPGRFVRRVIVETKGNNFGPSYQWRNWGLRAPLYLGTLRTIGDGSISRGVGKTFGGVLNEFGEFTTGFNEGYNQTAKRDSSSTPQVSTPKKEQPDSSQSQYSTLDSIRAASHQASLNYLDSLESNQ